ncbi:MAG: hypothetical protein MI867_24765, partial [Pseudomonadales bacterium]|nr:hypothetical protein [Pseudomonadales bacterium]
MGDTKYNGELAMQYVPASHSYLYFYDFDVLNVEYRTFESNYNNETVIYNGQVSREIRRHMSGGTNHWVLEAQASTLAINTATEHQRWIENLHFIKEIDGFGAYTILNDFVAAEGRIYDSNYGYFDISFVEPEHAGLPTIKVAGANSALHLGFYGGYYNQFNLGADLDNDGVVDAANDISLFGYNRYPVENTKPSISINSNAEDFAVSVGDSLEIDITAYDREYHLLNYEWTLVSAPEGSRAAINALGLDSLTFSPDLRGDYVFEFTVSDGEFSSSEQVTFSAHRDQPVVSFDNPESVNRGDTIEFDLIIDNADPDEPYPIRLAYAPVGMSIDNEGHITWVADQLVIDQHTKVNFGFYVGDEGREVLASSSLTLTTPANPAGVFHENDSYYYHDPVLHDIDNDGFIEIIQQTSSNYINVFEINDSEIVYESSFPLQLNYGLSTLDIAVINDTVLGVPLLLVASDEWISVVDLDTRSARAIYSVEDLLGETYVDLSTLMVSDIDNDGEDEVIISYDTNAIEALAVFDNGLAQIEWQSPVGVDVGNFLLAANMDGDTAQEIATKSGYIFDGATGENQWIYSEGINTTTTLDIDNDGADEILVSRENSYGRNSYTFIDIDTQETIEYVLEVQNRYCSDNYLGNFDDDPQAELLLRCNTNFDVYEFTDQGLELVSTIENELSTLTNARDRRVVDIAGKDY